MVQDQNYRSVEEMAGRAMRLGTDDLDLSGMKLAVWPEALGRLTHLKSLHLDYNKLTELPEWVSRLTQLRTLDLSGNLLTDLPLSLAKLKLLEQLNLDNNPLNPELAAAYKEGMSSVKRYLGAGPRKPLNEAKLILIGEGEVGKSCLLAALRGEPFVEGLSTTHGIEIKTVKVNHQGKEITLNGWDFGGQRIYRPTHQLFFSAPAVYLVVWKPREGPQQGFVQDWIKLVKHREPDAKILVVATHGGPGQRQPDIDRQELWELFGKDTVIDFFHVDSKPNNKGERRGIEDLRRAIAKVASELPEMERLVPIRWQNVREALVKTKAAYLPLEGVFAICHSQGIGNDDARLFVTIEHRLGHLIHYQHDPTLRNIVVLKPDWLATAISFVLDDEVTRKAHGLVHFSRLSQLWDDSSRTPEFRYPPTLHGVFVRLMERFDLSYRVADPFSRSDRDHQSLIAQLVPDNTPEEDLERVWTINIGTGDMEQTQICRIVDNKGQTSAAEGLFYQLIVRLHKYSLGRADHTQSVHWQRGLVLDDDYNGRALLRHVGNDVHITVRAPYPERFLAMLTEEVKYLVGSFWEGLRCDVMVPCLNPVSCNGLFEVRKLIENKRRERPEQPCPLCNEWQNIDRLLRNAPAAQPDATALIFAEFEIVKEELAKARQQLTYQGEKIMGRFDRLDDRTRRTLSRVDKTYTDFLQVLTDEAKEGPRLFSLVPVNLSNFDPQGWKSEKFRLTLWCEHSRLPLPELNENKKQGVYEFHVDRKWFMKVAPYLKFVMSTLSLILPIASSGIKLGLDDSAYNAIAEQLDFGKSVIEAAIAESKKFTTSRNTIVDTSRIEQESIHAQGATLRELHAFLKTKDPGFGGLVRVINKRQEFLWVHKNFSGEY